MSNSVISINGIWLKFSKIYNDLEVQISVLRDRINSFVKLHFRIFSFLKAIFIILILFLIIVFTIPLIQKIFIPVKSSKPVDYSLAEINAIAAQKVVVEKSIQKLDKKLAALIPWSPFLVVNTTENEYYLYRNRKLIKQGKCSTGSYILLENGEQQKWIFKTPRGEFRIQAKTTSPVWKKPDWAFIEEGLAVPSLNHSSRFEYGVLGDYSLSLGQGYLIHGTLYKRLLGLPVTHGCIRLNDEDLRLIYHTLNIGSRVYIY
jgi:L,D-transpeptidase ErfK/SrfK